MQPLARKLVRYALACEYSRTKITSSGIKDRVLGTNSGRVNKQVFAEAQNMLRETFGMEMVELAKNERTTLQARRGGLSYR